MIADFDGTSQAAASQRTGDVPGSSKHLLVASGANSGCQRKALCPRNQRRAARSCEIDATVIGLNDLNVHQRGELADKVSLLVDERARIFVHVLETGNLLIDARDLRGQ